MTPIPMNLNEVETWSGAEILPAGRHTCKVAEAKESVSSGGHDQIELELEATDGEFVGASIRDWIVITPATLGKVRQVLEAASVSIPEGEFKLDVQSLVGSLVAVTVREEEYDGKTRNRVKAYDHPKETDVPADTAGLPTNGSVKKDDDLPFARPRFPEFGEERRTWPTRKVGRGPTAIM